MGNLCLACCPGLVYGGTFRSSPYKKAQEKREDEKGKEEHGKGELRKSENGDQENQAQVNKRIQNDDSAWIVPSPTGLTEPENKSKSTPTTVEKSSNLGSNNNDISLVQQKVVSTNSTPLVESEIKDKIVASNEFLPEIDSIKSSQVECPNGIEEKHQKVSKAKKRMKVLVENNIVEEAEIETFASAGPNVDRDLQQDNISRTMPSESSGSEDCEIKHNMNIAHNLSQEVSTPDDILDEPKKTSNKIVDMLDMKSPIQQTHLEGEPRKENIEFEDGVLDKIEENVEAVEINIPTQSNGLDIKLVNNTREKDTAEKDSSSSAERKVASGCGYTINFPHTNEPTVVQNKPKETKKGYTIVIKH